MNKITINITGMHCRSCEILLENELSQIAGVKKVESSYKKGVVEISYDKKKPDESEIEKAVRQVGYSIGSQNEKEIINKNPGDYKDLGLAFLFLLGIYLIAKNLGLTNINLASGANNPSGLFVVLLTGLTAGFSTCLALVGGLVLGVSARHAEKYSQTSAKQKFKPHIFFNLGRILGFALLGGALGSLGSLFQLSSLAMGILTIAVGIVMLITGLQLTAIFPALDKIKFTWPKFFSRVLGLKKHQGKYSHKSSALLGAMTFFLPCGFTQAMQLYAVSAGNPLSGALIMGTFALGTVPGLLGIGGITSVIRGTLAPKFFKLAGLLVIFFAFFNIANGYNLTGWQINQTSSGDSSLVNNISATPENGVQIIRMTQLSNGYSPNKFTVQKGISVKWIITGQDPLSCSSSIVIPKMNLSKKLVKGENVVEFTPTESGALKFSCSMGMYTGVFNVVDEKDKASSASKLDTALSSSAASGSCHMSSGSCGCSGMSVQ